jgi:hypothetical protein
MSFTTIKKDDDVTVLGYLQTDANERLGVHNLLHVQDQKAAGTHGGTATSGAWRTRDLNTDVVNNISGASLTSNQISLPAGKYYVEGTTTAYRIGQSVARIFDVTGSELLVLSAFTRVDTTVIASVLVPLCGVFDIEETSVIELQHLFSTTRENNGLGDGIDIGQPYNVFSDLKFWKVA